MENHVIWSTAHSSTKQRSPRSSATTLLAMIAVLAGPVANASDTPSNKLSSTALHSKTDDPEMCAKRYHAKLGAEVLTRAQATLTIADAMRTPAAGMPGHWLFWDGSGIIARSARQRRLLATQQIHISENRMCVRSILARGGRIRCLKWKPIPAGYVPPKPNLPKVDPIKTEISPAERRIASQLGSRVIRKGAFAELEHGTAFYHMAQRTSDECLCSSTIPSNNMQCPSRNDKLLQAPTGPTTPQSSARKATTRGNTPCCNCHRTRRNPPGGGNNASSKRR